MRRVILAIVSTAAALVFLLSFKSHITSALAIPAPAATSATPASRASANASTPATGASTAAGSSSPSSTAGAGSKAASGTAKSVTGNTVDTIYGPVQVQVTVKNGKVTAAEAVEYPSQDPRDAQINSYAIPQLNQEATAAGSAQIDTVSGATYTSNGYISSLQSALDKAGL